MDIQLGSERIFAVEIRVSEDEARLKAMDRRTSSFGGGLGSLLQRPKADDVSLTTTQLRLEPIWHVVCRARYVYERSHDYSVTASTPEVREVTILGTTYPVAETGSAARTFSVPALEHCRDEAVSESYTNGFNGEVVPGAEALVGGAKHEVTDPATLMADNTVVLAPEQRASYVVRKALGEMLKPVQADRMLEESLVLENTDLYYRPIWAFEFDWASKGKRGVVEIDGITGEARSGGSLMPNLTKIVSRDALFDIGTDTVGLLVPGGGIAIKVARAALDKSY